MWVTEFAKRFYFKWYPKQLFITRFELCGTRVLDVSPFTRNLYILTGTIRSSVPVGENVTYIFCRSSGVFLWLFGNMASHRDCKEFRRRIKTSFSGCVSTDVRLFRRHLVESVQ